MPAQLKARAVLDANDWLAIAAETEHRRKPACLHQDRDIAAKAVHGPRKPSGREGYPAPSAEA